MAMVGLFWITEKFVYVGAEPEGYGRGVRLTPEGVEAVGTGQTGFWVWEDIRSVEVRDARVRASAGRMLVSDVLGSVLTAVTGDGDAPAAFEVHLETGDETGGKTVELDVFAAASGYLKSEYDLSVTLLERFVSGVADVSALLEWARGHVVEGTLRREEREVLLRGWMEG
ncbi:hypothetical protein [Streptomyces sp. NPDC002845]